jgi:hypothetical protein
MSGESVQCAFDYVFAFSRISTECAKECDAFLCVCPKLATSAIAQSRHHQARDV